MQKSPILALTFLFSASAIKIATRPFELAESTNDVKSLSESTWGQMQGYMNYLQKEASPEDDIKIEIMKALKPCAQCAAPKRYGEQYDGGYAMCSELMEKGKLTAGYSVGVAGYDGWGQDISTQLNVPIYQFDCTNGKQPTCPGCDFHFYDLCVAATNATADSAYKGISLIEEGKPQQIIPAEKYKSMKELMELNGHGNRGDMSDLVMQLDVEGYEWELFSDPSTADAMLEFSQISIEFHNVLKDPTYKRAQTISLETRLATLENLNKHFVVTHLHGNNARQMTKVGDYEIPMLLEVLYVRRSAIPTLEKCETDPKKWKEDAINVPKKPMVGDAHLPA